MTSEHSILEQVLDDFFEREARLATRGAGRRRIASIGRRLRECLNTDGFSIFDECCREVYELERRLDPERTFLRTMGGDDLFVGLSVFLVDPWLAVDLDERAEQLEIVERLINFLARRATVSHEEVHCHLPELMRGIAAARVGLYLASAAADPATDLSGLDRRVVRRSSYLDPSLPRGDGAA